MTALSAERESRNSWLLVLAAILASISAFFLHPLAFLVFVCLAAVINPTDEFKWLLLVAACLLFTILNVSRQLDGDLVNYVNVQDYIVQKPFFVLFEKDELQLLSGTYRLTEIGYYAPLWLVGQVIADGKTAVAITATMGIYIPTFLGLIRIGRSEKWSNGLIITVALFAFFAGINFVQTTHLIRQYISGAILFYSLSLFLSNRNWRAAFFALSACSVHNGTAMVIPLVAAICFLFPYGASRTGPTRAILGTLALSILMAATIAIVPILQGTFLKEDIPNIKVVHFVIVGTFFLTAHVALQIQHLRLKSIYYARLAFLVIYVLSLGFFILGLPLFALRYFVYLEWLYGLMLGAILFSMFRNTPILQLYARLAVSLAAAAILIGRVAVSEWTYGPGNNYFLSWNFFQVAQLVSR